MLPRQCNVASVTEYRRKSRQTAATPSEAFNPSIRPNPMFDSSDPFCTDPFARYYAVKQQLLNPPPSGYRIDITWENPSVLQKTKDVTLQANIPHDFGAQ